MVDWILDSLRAVNEIDAVHLVTNHRFAPDFERWALQRRRHGPRRRDDVERDRLGAMRGRRVHARAGESRTRRPGCRRRQSLRLLARRLHRVLAEQGRGERRSLSWTSATALASQYGIVGVAEDDRITSFVEKPDDPPSTLAATATYIYHREHVPLVGRYLAEGNAPDQGGSFIAWLHSREPVYAYRFTGSWLDIGDKEQLLAADNQLRRQHGLPERVEYQLEI